MSLGAQTTTSRTPYTPNTLPLLRPEHRLLPYLHNSKDSIVNKTEEPITETWLQEAGFRWHQLDRQPTKQWLLWLGDAIHSAWHSFEDLGIELASGVYNKQTGANDLWHCWLRSDTGHRYSRFIHVRTLAYQHELIGLVEGITGQAWDPTNHWFGAMKTPADAERCRREAQRLDVELLTSRAKWAGIEKDDNRGQALPEHYEAHEKARGTI